MPRHLLGVGEAGSSLWKGEERSQSKQKLSFVVGPPEVPSTPPPRDRWQQDGLQYCLKLGQAACAFLSVHQFIRHWGQPTLEGGKILGQAVSFRGNLPKPTSCWESKGLFLKAFTAVDFSKNLRSGEWPVPEGGVGTPESIQMLLALKWYLHFQLPRPVRQALGE